MKRVKAACICQTLHFLLKDDIVRNYAVKLVNEEIERYRRQTEDALAVRKYFHTQTKSKPAVNRCHSGRCEPIIVLSA